ncbi:tetratricopeptide repeat protein [Membranihabitans marinus]|uniref:tetratricopeptide repeat protein n=1 Tax=Membranihabitans marinus TaxID=1227546 RepID=UPI001F32E783|nr:tetratricopeptide repeat protein [Membranihabitans marinus]
MKNRSGQPYLLNPNYLFAIICMVVFSFSCQPSSQSDSSSNDLVLDTIPSELQMLNIEIQNNPTMPSVYLDRSRWLMAKGSFAAALSDVEKAINLDGENREAVILKADIELNYYRSLASIQTLKDGIEKWPDDLDLKAKLAEVYIFVEQYSLAKTQAHEILKIQPLSAQGFFLLGWVSKLQQDSTAAIGYFKKTVELDADQIAAWQELAELTQNSNPELSKIYYENGLTIEPHDTSLLHSYALFFQNQNDLESAKKQYQKIIDHYPNYEAALYNTGLLLMDQDSFASSIDYWNYLIKLDSTKGKYYYYRGICFELSEKYPMAKADYVLAADLDPTLPSIQAALKAIEEKVK